MECAVKKKKKKIYIYMYKRGRGGVELTKRVTSFFFKPFLFVFVFRNMKLTRHWASRGQMT